MKHNLILVTLTPDQIARAKEVNGKRRRITHALLCGPYGQLFGTEKQCLKYYLAWKAIFSDLSPKSAQTRNHEIEDYNSTWNLVEILIKESESVQPKKKVSSKLGSRTEDDIDRVGPTKKRCGFFKRIFS